MSNQYQKLFICFVLILTSFRMTSLCENKSSGEFGSPRSKDYEEFYDKLMFGVKNHKLKSAIILLIFSAFNSFEMLKKPKFIQNCLSTKNNFSRFMIFKDNLKPSNKEKNSLHKEIKKIIVILKKSTFSVTDSFEEHLNFLFPKIDKDLYKDFLSLQKLILLNCKCKQFYNICDALFYYLRLILLDANKKDRYKALLQLDRPLNATEKKYLKCELLLNYSHGVALYNNFCLFISHSEINKLSLRKNKCIRILKDFINAYNENSCNLLKKIDQINSGLSISIHICTRQENFIVLFIHLLYIAKFDVKDKSKSNEHLKELLNKYLEIHKSKNLAILAQECHIVYTKIKSYLLYLCSDSVDENDSFSTKNTADFLKNAKIMFENAYFMTLMYGYTNTKFNDIFKNLEIFLRKNVSSNK